MPAAPRDGTNFKACADAACEVIIKGENRVAMAKRFRIVELILIQSPGRLELYVDRRTEDDTSGWVEGTGEVSLADGITITILRNDRSGALIRFTPS